MGVGGSIYRNVFGGIRNRFGFSPKQQYAMMNSNAFYQLFHKSSAGDRTGIDSYGKAFIQDKA